MEVTPDPELNNTGVLEARVVETAEPDVEANFSDPTEAGRDEESVHDDDVSETHPGVYRSGHEVFDEAQSAPAAQDSETTDEVDATSKLPPTSSGSGAGGEDDHSSSREDTDRAGVDSIPDTEFGEIDVDRIDANPRQPRTFFDEDQLSELVHSIREIGVLQPVVVRQKPSDSERFELIMGERRLRATKDAGLATIPAIIRYVDDTDLLRDALLENLHRAELNPLEEAAAYGQLLEDFGCTQEELSERIGRSRPQISNTLRLLRLPPLVQRRVAAGVISAGHARAILGLREPEHMEVLAQRIVAEGLSVRASEEAVVLLNRGDSMNVSRATTRVAPQFVEVAERLGDRLDTKVNITVGKKKGKLSVEFANQHDLDRILSLLGVESLAE
ncbi:ParB/RepB/Spo0J family partition protein [Brevibacterium antiquum]|uniref:ParB/RepB/Spo0J family partition protein n=1 Tax=Brevibacterium antiquum TaxID=234835 RepID=UPI001F31843F|nr:ParB/RepB/Spo0J family partition protein [Brevibacterium antiquum]